MFSGDIQFQLVFAIITTTRKNLQNVGDICNQKQIFENFY